MFFLLGTDVFFKRFLLGNEVFFKSCVFFILNFFSFLLVANPHWAIGYMKYYCLSSASVYPQ